MVYIIILQFIFLQKANNCEPGGVASFNVQMLKNMPISLLKFMMEMAKKYINISLKTDSEVKPTPLKVSTKSQIIHLTCMYLERSYSIMLSGVSCVLSTLCMTWITWWPKTSSRFNILSHCLMWSSQKSVLFDSTLEFIHFIHFGAAHVGDEAWRELQGSQLI